MEWEVGLARCKMLYIEWINNKVLLYSTGNYTKYPMIKNNGKKFTIYIYTSLMALMVTNLPAVQETVVGSLGQEDPLEKGKAAHSSILACRIPWTGESGRLYSPWGRKESDMTEPLTPSLSL